MTLETSFKSTNEIIQKSKYHRNRISDSVRYMPDKLYNEQIVWQRQRITANQNPPENDVRQIDTISSTCREFPRCTDEITAGDVCSSGARIFFGDVATLLSCLINVAAFPGNVATSDCCLSVSAKNVFMLRLY